MDTECELHLVGPIETRADAERLLDAVMTSMGYARATRAPSAPLTSIGASILAEKSGHWLSVELAVVPRLVREAPGLRVYRAFIQNRFDSETHGGELARLEPEGDPPRLVARVEEEIEEEDLVRGGVLPEVTLFYLLGFMAEHGEVDPPTEPLDLGTWITYAPLRSSASPAVERALRALDQAARHEASEIAGRWQLRMILADGSRRVLFLTPDEWAELRAARDDLG